MLLIYNAKLVDKNTDHKGALLIDGKKIKAVLTEKEAGVILAGRSSLCKNRAQLQTYNAHGLTVMPSFIDMHAHFRDPGFTQKEDIESGCKAAVAGGYGTVVLMPNTKPVISSESQVEANEKKAEALHLVNVIQSASITKDFDGISIAHIEKLTQKKVPLITEDGHEVANPVVMLAAMMNAAQKKIIVSCHCEDPDFAAQAKEFRTQALALLQSSNVLARGKTPAAVSKKAASLLTSANKYLEVAEDVATFRNIRLAESAGCHVHLCHVSTAACIQAVRAAKLRGDNITCEITPHHLGLTGTKIPNVFAIVNPPLRSEDDRRALIEALVDGTADTISTDHAPHTAEDKIAGSPGFTGLETAFALCNTVLVKGENNPFGKKISLSRLSALMTANAAKILGLKKCGALAAGFDANMVIVDPNKKWKVHSASFASKGKYTPLEGKILTGKIVATFYNGKQVFSTNVAV